MNSIHIKQNPKVAPKFEAYPDHIQPKMQHLRDLILQTAEELEHLQEIEETLKWGEPSYLAKKGSTVRMDWKTKAPNQYALYFSCSTRLVETFRMVYGELFRYEKNRAILFDLEEELPEPELKECLKMALQYHLVKDQPFLGK
ncbi:MAG: DUF1801 domain-containing protein [Bacteroidota bacterium]